MQNRLNFILKVVFFFLKEDNYSVFIDRKSHDPSKLFIVSIPYHQRFYWISEIKLRLKMRAIKWHF